MDILNKSQSEQELANLFTENTRRINYVNEAVPQFNKLYDIFWNDILDFVSTESFSIEINYVIQNKGTIILNTIKEDIKGSVIDIITDKKNKDPIKESDKEVANVILDLFDEIIYNGGINYGNSDRKVYDLMSEFIDEIRSNEAYLPYLLFCNEYMGIAESIFIPHYSYKDIDESMFNLKCLEFIISIVKLF